MGYAAMEGLIPALTSAIVSSIFILGMAFAIRKGWIPGMQLDTKEPRYAEVVRMQGEKIEALEGKVKELTILLEEKRVQETQYIKDLLEAYRKINYLEAHDASTRARVKELETQLGIIKEGRVKVLGIWTHLDQAPLDQDGEKGAIYNAGIDYVAISGKKATKDAIFRELRRDGISILEIGSHGTKEGILLEDGLAEAGWWERIIRGKGRPVRIAVLLACHSDYSITDALLRAGVGYVIAVNGEIKDSTAVAFAKAFYANYAEGLEVEQSYEYALLVIDRTEAECFRLRRAESS